MADQDPKKLEIEDLEATELEEGDLDSVAGGLADQPVNNGCTVTNNC